MTRQTGTSERGKAASQRDRLAGLLHDVRCQCGRPVETDFTRANALLVRGVRIVDADTLAAALHRLSPEQTPDGDNPRAGWEWIDGDDYATGTPAAFAAAILAALDEQPADAPAQSESEGQA